MRIAYHAIDGTGLGHLHRLCNIASAVRRERPEVHQLLITTAQYTGYPRALALPLVCIPPSKEELVLRFDRRYAGVSENFAVSMVESAITAYGPDAVVFDTYVSVELLRRLEALKCLRILVYRQCTEERVAWRLSRGYFSQFNSVIIPHARDDFVAGLGQDTKALILRQPHFRYSGHISRPVTERRVERVRRRYSIEKHIRLAVITCGSGGYGHLAVAFLAKMTECALELVHEGLIDRIICVTGPHFWEEQQQPPPPIEIVSEELDMPELMACSDIVFSNAGYNSVGEVLSAGARGILIPASRDGEKQEGNLPGDGREACIHLLSSASSRKEIVAKAKDLLSRQKPTIVDLPGAGVAARLVLQECGLTIAAASRLGEVRPQEGNGRGRFSPGGLYDLSEIPPEMIPTAVRQILNEQEHNSCLSFVYREREHVSPSLAAVAAALRGEPFDWLIARVPDTCPRADLADQIRKCKAMNLPFKVDLTHVDSPISAVDTP